MITVTQACVDPRYKPLGIVAAQSEWVDGKIPQIASLIRRLEAKVAADGPSGTTHLFNLTFETQEYHGNTFLFGYADAYAEPKQGVSEQEEELHALQQRRLDKMGWQF